MRKFLTTGLFSAILGLAVGAPADAALVSRGFLDEALTSYATTTALDLKADNADLTNLSNIVGELPDIDWEFFRDTPDVFFYRIDIDSDNIPSNLSDIISLLFNDILPKIINGSLVGNSQTNIKGLRDLTQEVNKIGTLPTEYATVGAALTAIKGIAEDAKAAALAAIPDPKQEGSTGKYVLTVDIVGDNATYRWEKIDREGETTTTTE